MKNKTIALGDIYTHFDRVNNVEYRIQVTSGYF